MSLNLDFNNYVQDAAALFTVRNASHQLQRRYYNYVHKQAGKMIITSTA